jgi:hypothetical protein
MCGLESSPPVRPEHGHCHDPRRGKQGSEGSRQVRGTIRETPTGNENGVSSLMALRPDPVVPLGMRDGCLRHHNVMKRNRLNLLTGASLFLCALSTMALVWVLYTWQDAARSNTARGWERWAMEPIGDGVGDLVRVRFYWVVVNDHVLQLVYAGADMSRAESDQFWWGTHTTLPNPPSPSASAATLAAASTWPSPLGWPRWPWQCYRRGGAGGGGDSARAAAVAARVTAPPVATTFAQHPVDARNAARSRLGDRPRGPALALADLRGLHGGPRPAAPSLPAPLWAVLRVRSISRIVSAGLAKA